MGASFLGAVGFIPSRPSSPASGSTSSPTTGFIDLDEIERVRDGLRRWPDIDNLAPDVTEFAARFYSFSSSMDVGVVERAAQESGFETYPYRRDLVVVDPDRPRRSTMRDPRLDEEAEDDG